MDLPMIKAAGLYDDYVTYALYDVDLCARIFKKLVVDASPNGGPEFPMQEIPILDMLMRMTTQPSFVLDRDRLALHLHNVRVVKQRVLDAIGTDKTLIRQNETFADMLRAQGVDPPRKISPTTGLELYAFSKTDEEFLELEQHSNPIVQALCAARLGAKSTIEETRAQRFINISNLQWPVTIRSNSMPMPVRFSGAHTHRGSGDWKLNVQNMTRGGELRKALRAPPGYKVVTVDASQIEARITAFLAGQTDLLEQFENGDDVYSNFASIVYERPINKIDHPVERFVGKTCILGLGFGMGWRKFHRQINLSKMVAINEDQAASVVYTYRTTFNKITALRSILGGAIPLLASNGCVKIGPVVIEENTIYMPGRLKMFYHKLQHKDGEWTFEFAGKPKRLYGGRVLENIVQYLDRIIVFDAAIRIEHRFKALGWGYHLAQQAHDENGYVVKDEHVEQVRAILHEEMTRRPSWGETLPLMAEVGVGDNYGEAK
jgi:DNA polymerase